MDLSRPCGRVRRCFPTGYVTYTTLNVLAAACANGRCSAAGMNAATDANTETSAGIAVLGGLATLVVNLASPATLASVTVKTSSSAPVTVKLLPVPGSGNASVVLLGTSASYTLTNFLVPSSAQAVAALCRWRARLASTVFEVAARAEACFEFVAVDLGSLQTVAGLTIRHWAGSGSPGWLNRCTRAAPMEHHGLCCSAACHRMCWAQLIWSWSHPSQCALCECAMSCRRG